MLDAQTGRVYPAEHPFGLRMAIQEFIDQPGLAASLRTATRQRADHFHIDRMAAEYEDLLRSVAAAPAAAHRTE